MKITTSTFSKWLVSRKSFGLQSIAGAALLFAATDASAIVVTTLGGGPLTVNGPSQGFVDGNTAASSQFNVPSGIAIDASGTMLFVADCTNNAVRYISDQGNAATSVTGTFAGANNGINRPAAVLVDGRTNVFVLNRGNGNNGYVLQFDGLYVNYGVPPIFITTNAYKLTNATAMAMDGMTNLYVTVRSNTVIKITLPNTVSVVGVITNAGTSLRGIAPLDNGMLALSDGGNHGIWIMNPNNGSATKLTGFHGAGYTNGPPIFAAFNRPEMISKAGSGVLVVADRGNHRVRLVDVASGTVSRLYGVRSNLWIQGSQSQGIFPGWWDGTVNLNENLSGSVEAREPFGVVVGPDGSVYTTEVYYHLVRKTTATGLSAPGPLPVPPLFNGPRGIGLDNSSTLLFIADQTNNAIRALDLINNTTTTFLDSTVGINRPSAVEVDDFDNIFVLNQGTGGNGNIVSFDPYGNSQGTNISGLSSPTAMTIDFAGNFWVAELNGTIQEFSSGGTVSNTIVTIPNAGVQLNGIALFDDGTIAVSDTGNHVIWQVNPVSKAISVLTGSIGVSGSTLGTAAFAKLNQPRQLAKASGNQLLVADSGNNRLAMVTRSGSVTNILKSTNSVVWFGHDGEPYNSSNAKWVPMASPFGVAIGAGGEVFDSETLNNNIRKIVNTGITPPPPPSPAPAPSMGWVDFQPPITPVSVLVIGNSFVFNNDKIIAIQPNGAAQVFYTFGPTESQALIPDPNATNGTTAPFYQDGLLPGSVAPSIVAPQPDVTVKAVGMSPGSLNSSITQARFQWVAANPFISGNNAAQFNIKDATIGSELWYTTDGSEPVRNAPSLLAGVIANSNGIPLSLAISGTTNLTFKAKAFKNNYQPSATLTTVFSATNFIANTISFGFAAGEASSDFVGSPGQIFYAPVTLNVLPETLVYSLQFNVTVTNAGPNPGPQIYPGAYGFESFLVKPIPSDPNVFEIIPPLMFSADPNTPPGQFITNTFDGSTNFISLLLQNTNINLLGVGWLERIHATNLYDTTAQDLIKYSQPHDTRFEQDNGKIVLGGYAFQIPLNATPGQTYRMQIDRPSATSDGIGAPGSSVFIFAPTNGAVGEGAINSIKVVTTGQRKYVAGDSAPFRWFNAGDFGNTNLDNSDVVQVFQSAIYSLNYPPPGSDFFDSMDSCGAFGTDFGGGYLEFNGLITDTNALFDGNDVSINDVVFGDGKLDVCDVFVTFRRSLDPSLTWYRRFWTNGVRGAETTVNEFHPLSLKKKNFSSSGTVSITNQPSVNFVGGDIQGAAGQVVQIPITAQIFGSYPLRVLMLNVNVEPLDGSPALTAQVQFTPSGSLGAPTLTSSSAMNNFAAVWLNSSVAGLSNNATIGTLSVTIPNGASSKAAYAIHFDHASGSPNGIASLPAKTLTGLITTSARTNSSYGDGVPDSWRLRYFGTTNNVLSQASADADGDGMNNLHEFIAGTDPLDVKSNLRVGNNQAEANQNGDSVIHWPSVFGKQYVIERSANLFAPVWTSVSTNNGTGTEMQIHDTAGGNARFYRVRVLP